MAEYESKLGKRQLSGQPMRDFNVPDASNVPQQVRNVREEQPPPFDPEAMRDFQAQMQPPQPVRQMSEVEQQILAQKKAQREGKERLSPGARNRIEKLVGMSRLTKDVEIGGLMYRLQSLTSKEFRDAIVATAEFDGSVQQIFEARKQTLAHSLVIIAGSEANQFLASDDFQVKLDFIEELDHALLLRLYNEYTALAKEVQDKYSLKTEEEVKQVLTDLKK